MYLKHIISEAEKWIAAYSSSFHNEDKEAMWGIGLKEAHIGFVRRNCKELAQWLKLTEHDVLLAELIGLLHDVGRTAINLALRFFALQAAAGFIDNVNSHVS